MKGEKVAKGQKKIVTNTTQSGSSERKRDGRAGVKEVRTSIKESMDKSGRM